MSSRVSITQLLYAINFKYLYTVGLLKSQTLASSDRFILPAEKAGYFDYDIEKKRIYRKKGENYHLSPFAMIYTDDNYYLLAFDADKEEVRPFRVDRMEGVNVLKAYRRGHEAYKKIDMSRYTNYTFSMYGGEIEQDRKSVV